LGITGLIERANASGRHALLADFVVQLRNAGRYIDTVEELTPYRDDALSLVPLLKVRLTLLASPSTAMRSAATRLTGMPWAEEGTSLSADLLPPVTGICTQTWVAPGRR
jgi:hypothetical protein